MKWLLAIRGCSFERLLLFASGYWYRLGKADAARVSGAKLSRPTSQHKGRVVKEEDGAIIFQENKVWWESSTSSLQGVTLEMANAALGHREHVQSNLKWRWNAICWLQQEFVANWSSIVVILLTCFCCIWLWDTVETKLCFHRIIES